MSTGTDTGRGHKCPNTRCRIQLSFSSAFCSFLSLLYVFVNSSRVPLKIKNKKRERNRRGCRPLKGELELLKINLNRCPPLLKCICSDLPLSSLFTLAAVYHLLCTGRHQPRRCRFVCSHYLPHTHTHTIMSSDTSSICTWDVEPEVRDGSSEIQHCERSLAPSRSRDEWSVSELRFPQPATLFFL